MLLPDILLKSYSENFWEIPKKTPLKKSCFNNDQDYRPETFLKHNLTYVTYMLKIILLFLRATNFEKILKGLPRCVTFVNKE